MLPHYGFGNGDPGVGVWHAGCGVVWRRCGGCDGDWRGLLRSDGLRIRGGGDGLRIRVLRCVCGLRRGGDSGRVRSGLVAVDGGRTRRCGMISPCKDGGVAGVDGTAEPPPIAVVQQRAADGGQQKEDDG